VRDQAGEGLAANPGPPTPPSKRVLVIHTGKITSIKLERKFWGAGVIIQLQYLVKVFLESFYFIFFLIFLAMVNFKRRIFEKQDVYF